MANGEYYISVYPSLVSTNLDNVQSIDLRVGRTSWGETIQASELRVVARYPEGYTTPNDGLIINGQITLTGKVWSTVFSQFTQETLWDGVISSIEVNYEKPWNGTEGAGDTVLITAVGYLSELGNYTTLIQPNAGNKPLQESLDQLYSVGIDVSAPDAPNVYVTADPTTQNVAEWATALAYTRPWIVNEDSASLVFSYQTGVQPTFSETTSSLTARRYDSVRFTSLQFDYANQVTVTGQNTAHTGTFDDGSGGPYQQVELTSLSPNDADAQLQAEYYWETYSNNAQRVAQIVAYDEQQTTYPLPDMSLGAIGSYVRVKFRGDNYDCFVIGYELNATPASGRWTFYVVPKSFAGWLVLDDDGTAIDSPSLGALDENRLGY